MDISKEIKQSFVKGNIVTRLIYANVAFFILIRLVNVVLQLTGLSVGEGEFVLPWVSVPALPTELLFKPWTVFTYMFSHFGFFHLLINMWMLFWFGKLFVQIFGSKQLLGLYIMGGIGGAIIFIVFYNLFPFFSSQVATSILLGASASVLAIIAASAFGAPNMEIQLMFIGRVKLIYVGLAAILIDLYSMTSSNAGGHIAHLGGALAGYLFIVLLRKNVDITLWVNVIADKIIVFFQPQKRKMKVKWRRPSTEQEYRNEKATEQKDIDEVLDKIKASGYESLTTEEKRKLFDAGK